eukprot:CAMPEP_0119571952 /NCGR_PEP_ID=MMETSP1352-20130426/44378_1 /TAXON_ID=265584 /ORGANISM="Stauroneis constricta, Strain CCMP1120" /LENGTH=477 /DNA_ID=CAMNT_0007621635 /DNA_START=120 /DNA_END=1552 /DNA_ORIENTATION=-
MVMVSLRPDQGAATAATATSASTSTSESAQSGSPHCTATVRMNACVISDDDDENMEHSNKHRTASASNAHPSTSATAKKLCSCMQDHDYMLHAWHNDGVSSVSSSSALVVVVAIDRYHHHHHHNGITITAVSKSQQSVHPFVHLLIHSVSILSTSMVMVSLRSDQGAATAATTASATASASASAQSGSPHCTATVRMNACVISDDDDENMEHSNKHRTASASNAHPSTSATANATTKQRQQQQLQSMTRLPARTSRSSSCSPKKQRMLPSASASSASLTSTSVSSATTTPAAPRSANAMLSLQNLATAELEEFRQSSDQERSFPVACQRLVAQLPGNANCMDCGRPHPQWATVSFGALICLDCAGHHRSFGVSTSTVRSITMDHWKLHEILSLLEGGNQQLSVFFQRHHLHPQTTSFQSQHITKQNVIQIRYKTKAGQFYRHQLLYHIQNSVSFPYVGRQQQPQRKRMLSSSTSNIV